MNTSPAAAEPCSTCGTTLTAQGDCVACLVQLALDPSYDDLSARVFGDYEVVRQEDGTFWELGRGAMGVTYRAQDTVLNRMVALKVIEAPQAREQGQAVRERFLREARSAAALHHPNVAGVFHASAEGDRCYYAMELVEGETLEALVRRDGPLKVEVALEIAVQVTRALIAAAGHGLIHRDLKPGNIMLKRSDVPGAALEVKVIDFGLAKAVTGGANEMELTHGGFLGTPAFASPEQFAGAPADARSDIYSLGVTLWYALTGEVPYEGRTIDEIRRCQTELALPLVNLTARKIPKPVIQLLSRVLALDPAERPGSARELMEVLEHCRARLGYTPAPRRSSQQRILALALLLVVSAGVVVAFFTSRESRSAATRPAVVAEKSIAVLPFENRSGEQENAFFADGVQDEILTTLARVADLKVIGRTSVMPFREVEKRNLSNIAQQLGVVHVVEGSVQRAANRVRVTVRLVDTRTNTQVWAESYDRALADALAIQSDIAQQITRELQVTLSAREKSVMESRPTQNLAAFDLYTRAKTLRLATAFSPAAMKSLLEGVELLNNAVALDPAFLLAWYELATAHDLIYFGGADHTPARLALAENAVQTALRLRPDAGEAHLASAQHLYWGYLDYDNARAELELARRTLPNDSQIYSLTAFMDRRQGRWTESSRNLERALELDPRNSFTLRQMGLTYRNLRRNAERAAILDRAIAVDPTDVRTRVARATHDVHWHADTKPLRATLEAILAAKPEAASSLADDLLFLALCERDPAAADRALALFGADRVQSSSGWLSRAFSEGTVARMRGDPVAAHAAFTKARAEQEEALRTQPDYAPALCALGIIEAALGNKEAALRIGRRAMEIVPVERDSMDGADMIEYFAIACAWAGETELALQHLEIVAKIPSSLSYGQLKLSPYWDPLRSDPRFEEITASLAPKP